METNFSEEPPVDEIEDSLREFFDKESAELKEMREQEERLVSRIDDLHSADCEAAANVREQELRELETRIRLQEAADISELHQRLKNHLIQYEGGGYDGCMWTWEFAWIDSTGTWCQISDTHGFATCYSLADLKRKVKPGRIFIYDFSNQKDIDEFASESNTGHIVGIGKWLNENQQLNEFADKLQVTCDCCECKFPACEARHTGYHGAGGIAIEMDGLLCQQCLEDGTFESQQFKEDWDSWGQSNFEKDVISSLETLSNDLDNESDLEKEQREAHERYEFNPEDGMTYDISGKPIPAPSERVWRRKEELEEWSSEKWLKLWEAADGSSYLLDECGGFSTHFETNGAVRNVIDKELFWED